jgi:hypothetical protein
MRRADKEIQTIAAIEDMIARACICHVGFSDGQNPYVLPLCFGYERKTFFFHSAAEGRKIDVLRHNPRVCINVVSDYDILPNPKACSFSARYESVIGFGEARFLADMAEKRQAFDRIMRRYADASLSFDYSEEALQRTVIFSVFCETLTAKVSG